MTRAVIDLARRMSRFASRPFDMASIPHQGLIAGLCPQFGPGIAQVQFDGHSSKTQVARDGLGAHPLGQKLEALSFAP